jgi:nucleotide-binding universal stress UspA family protein
VRPIVGDVPGVILDVQAEEEKPALLSFGSKVLGKAGRVMVGEVLDWVLGETTVPILVTPEPHPASKARAVLERAELGAQEAPAVLVATDGSEVSLRAGEYAARLAGSLGAKLFVLYVVDEHLTFHAGVHYREFIEKLTQDGREATGKVRALAEKVGVEAEELVVLGRPEQTILSVAEELGADPIILGAEGTSRLEHALIGSVSEDVLRHANRTVLVVGGHPDDGSSEGEYPGAGQ